MRGRGGEQVYEEEEEERRRGAERSGAEQRGREGSTCYVPQL
jgi:hypothetical protein